VKGKFTYLIVLMRTLELSFGLVLKAMRILARLQPFLLNFYYSFNDILVSANFRVITILLKLFVVDISFYNGTLLPS